MLVAVGSAEEAAMAIEGGADRLVVRAVDVRAGLSVAACQEIGRIVAGRCPVSLWIDEPGAAPWSLLCEKSCADEVYLPFGPATVSAAAELGGARRFARMPSDGGAPETVFDTAAAEGFDGVLLGDNDARRLLQVQTVGQWQQQVHGAHARKLLVGFAGRIEAPDIPRLLAIAPDLIVFDGMVRREGHNGRPLDLERLRYVRDLMPAHPPAEPSLRGAADNVTGLDRIFVRDWLVEIHIGAYAHERAAQRVRFTVEVEVVRVAARAADMRHVVTYDLITDAISRATVEHVDLVETVAEDVASAILMHPRATMVDITVEKLDLGPGSLGCRLVRRRDRPL